MAESLIDHRDDLGLGVAVQRVVARQVLEHVGSAQALEVLTPDGSAIQATEASQLRGEVLRPDEQQGKGLFALVVYLSQDAKAHARPVLGFFNDDRLMLLLLDLGDLV